MADQSSNDHPTILEHLKNDINSVQQEELEKQEIMPSLLQMTIKITDDGRYALPLDLNDKTIQKQDVDISDGLVEIYIIFEDGFFYGYIKPDRTVEKEILSSIKNLEIVDINKLNINLTNN